MFRATIVLAAFVAVAFCAPVPEAPAVPENFEDIPAEFKGLIPAEVAEHLKAITPEEKAVLKELALNHKSYKNEQEFLTAVEAKSPSLHGKAVKLQGLLQERYNKLDADSQTLVKAIISKGRELHGQYLAGEKPTLESLKTLAQGYIKQYQALPQSSKDTVAQQFPILTGFFQNEKVQALVGQYIN